VTKNAINIGTIFLEIQKTFPPYKIPSSTMFNGTPNNVSVGVSTMAYTC
jgi:hypothetical protein